MLQSSASFLRNGLLLASLGILGGSHYADGSQKTNRKPETISKPNFVILFVDDLGYNDVGFRNEKFSTPNIDRLRKQGVVFSNAYVPSPTCSPSRVGLYTGQHPARLQFYRHCLGNGKEYNVQNGDTSLLLSREWLPLEVETYAEVVKKEGYNTFFVGKWHLGDENFGPQKQGFDTVWSNAGAGSVKSFYTPYFQGKGFWNDIPNNQYLTDFYTDKAVDYIKSYQKVQPFLLQFSYHNVHTPNVGRKDFLEMYKKKGFKDKMIEFGAQVSAMDASVGRIMDALDQAGKSDNTVVIFTSDQGSFFPNLPLRGTKEVGTTLYEGGQKVPFIMKWTGVIKEGGEIKSNVQTTDIFPTICEITGSNPKKYTGLEGLSLLSILKKDKPLERSYIFAFRSYDAQYASVLSKDNWKLIAYRDGRNELYKVDEDLSEKFDLAKTNPQMTQKLLRALRNWEKEVGVYGELYHHDSKKKQISIN